MPREDARSKFAVLQEQQKELLVLGELSGIQIDPTIYRIIVELLSMQIEPEAIYKLLRHIRKNSKPGKMGSVRKNNQ